MRILSGITDQFISFIAPAGTTGFAVYLDKNGDDFGLMTTPTIVEVTDNMGIGMFNLLLDENMVIGAGNISESMGILISAAGITPIFKEVEIFSLANYVVGKVTVNTDMRGTNSAALASVCTEARLVKLANMNITAGNVHSEPKVITGHTLKTAGVGNKNVGATV